MKMGCLHLLVAAALLPAAVVALSSCIESSISIHITAEGRIRGSFVGLEHTQAGEILTSCGMKCGCLNDVYLCCSNTDCIQMERKCATEDRTNEVHNGALKFDSNGHHQVSKRSVLLEKVLSGRAAAMRRDRRDTERIATTLEATTVTPDQDHSHDVTSQGVESIGQGHQGVRNGEHANLGRSAVKYISRQKRSSGDDVVRVKRDDEEFMEDVIVTTTVEESSEVTDAPENHGRGKRSIGALAQNLEREKRSVAGDMVRVKREEEFMEDAIETTTVEASSEVTDATGNHGYDRKKRSNDAANLADPDCDDDERRKRSAGEEMVRVKRAEEEFMEDAIVTTTMSSDSEPTDSPGEHGSDRKKREALDEIVLTTISATTEQADVYVTDVFTTLGSK